MTNITGCYGSSWGFSEGLRNLDFCTPEPSYDCENPKESESPRFQAILRVTSAPRRKYPADIKSFSHELNSKGVRPFPLWKSRRLNNLEEILVMIRAKFDKAKEEVDSDLAIFAADLVGVLEKNVDTHPEWQETIEDLLVLARSCAMSSPGEFWLQCESIVQELDDRRQELPPGMLKQLHTRILFILTRCTRLLQFHKESGLAEDENVFQLRQSRNLHSADKRMAPAMGRETKSSSAAKASKTPSSRKSYSQEQRGLDWSREHDILPGNNVSTSPDDTSKNLVSPTGRDRIASWKRLPSPAPKTVKESTLKDQGDNKKFKSLNMSKIGMSVSETDFTAAKVSELPLPRDSHDQPTKHQHKPSWGWGDQPTVSDESSIICRICEEEIPTANVEDHSRICAVADRCDQKGISVNERLLRIAETLEKMIESFTQKDSQHVGSPDVAKVSNSSMTEESDISPKHSDWSRRGSEDMLDCFHETDSSVFMDDLKGLPSMSCKTRFGPKSDQGMTTSSAGSMTPRSPLLTPRTSQFDLFLAGKGAYYEHDDLTQISDLADIARCSANTPLGDDCSMQYLLTCLEDLRVVINRRKFNALTVDTFGTRIEKLIREKYLQLCELVDDEKIDLASTVIDEDTPLEDDIVRSLRTSPIHSSKDRTSIDDFEIIKPISRGAFGRVFLAKKRTTGDLFAIKVLKKADMIRKNAVESILAERNILISVRNPFVVRFFYSFTCRDNLYLVMEYLNGGDLYSLLRNLGCLDEEVARVYIAEVVLALEYLHSLGVVHRDLKPDNLLIAHDGHIKHFLLISSPLTIFKPQYGTILDLPRGPEDSYFQKLGDVHIGRLEGKTNRAGGLPVTCWKNSFQRRSVPSGTRVTMPKTHLHNWKATRAMQRRSNLKGSTTLLSQKKGRKEVGLWNKKCNAGHPPSSPAPEIVPLFDENALISLDQGSIKDFISGDGIWQSTGSFHHKFEKWDKLKHNQPLVMKGFGGWLIIKNLPLDYCYFADNTLLFPTADPAALTCLFEVIHVFEQASGLSINL
ncbi:putative serine/threonine protein kinase IREH1 [Cucumis melo var. makuwa]|uniref:non-specific serine/threonine protein kinase n=1 Tax=Cucumis melo var. makuwa TaxID=1194695 RepID=A0A5D3BHR7_CUCMM|nr:putative serine/threonine protein kinase IREH1 [Cucumis melo var. makuwa]